MAMAMMIIETTCQISFVFFFYIFLGRGIFRSTVLLWLCCLSLSFNRWTFLVGIRPGLFEKVWVVPAMFFKVSSK